MRYGVRNTNSSRRLTETLPLTIYDPFDDAQDMFTIDYLISSLRPRHSLR